MNWQEKCKSMWGSSWGATLALTANVNRRTVRRWKSGESKIKQAVVDKIDKTYDIWR